MNLPIPIIFSAVAILLFSAIEILLLRRLHPSWWKRRGVRAVSFAVPLLGLVSLVIWLAGSADNDRTVMEIGIHLAASMMVAGICLMLSLPLAALLHRIDALLLRRRRRATAPDEPEEGRRRLLKAAAAGIPIITLTAGGTGVASALSLPILPEIRLRFPTLPAGLEGFRIAQISDLHLGFILGLSHLERIAALVADAHPDIVLLTGDFCDDAALYADALAIAARIPARCGVHASIGNHEYFRGIDRILAAYRASTVPLLLDSGSLITAGTASFWLAGANDPKTLSHTSEQFFIDTVTKATQGAPPGSFTVLMSHRPEGFNHASSIGIPLTLAGHTHGGQIGFMGRSIFEGVWPGRMMWGRYERNGCQLYTSAGAGHWFPYRLGCPSEVPVVVLERG